MHNFKLVRNISDYMELNSFESIFIHCYVGPFTDSDLDPIPNPQLFKMVTLLVLGAFGIV